MQTFHSVSQGESKQAPLPALHCTARTAMAAREESKQTWIPYQPTKDCSIGFCSIYCHHWCYLVFPPPPPTFFLPPRASRLAFSPLAIAIVGVLVAAFLLVSYFAIISKSCGRLDELRRRLRRRRPGAGGGGGGGDDEESLRRRESWRVSPRHGLEQAVIDTIELRRYRRGGGVVESTDCSICLGEFREDESLRLLPKCGHAFHLLCIDTWLKSHSNCPLCRAAIAAVSPDPAPPVPLLWPQPPAPAAAAEEMEHGVDAGEEGSQMGGTAEAIPQRHGDMGGREGSAIVEVRDCDFQSLRRSSSMGSLHRGKNSIREMMESSREEEFSAAKESSSSVRMKRSFSSERLRGLAFSRNGRGRNAILPL